MEGIVAVGDNLPAAGTTGGSLSLLALSGNPAKEQFMEQSNGIWVGEIYASFKDKVYGYFLRRLNSPEMSEDLTSQVFLEVAKNAERFDKTKSSESTWIYTISRNLCNRYLRDFYARRHIAKKYNIARIQHGGNGNHENADVERLIAAHVLTDALSRLNTDKNRVIVLSYYHGLTPREIACRLGLSYTNVCVLKSRAIRELREILD